MKRILPFPRRPIPMTKVWNDDEQQPSIINEKTVSDFTRVCTDMKILDADKIAE